MRSLVLASCLLAFGTIAAAQVGRPADDGAKAAPAARTGDGAPKPAPRIDADKLGISVSHIQLRFLRTPTFGETFDPERLRLSSYVDVVAVAPMLELFGPDAKKELTSHAVPWGAPTHQAIIDLTTPPEYRRPVFDLTALSEWLTRGFTRDKSE